MNPWYPENMPENQSPKSNVPLLLLALVFLLTSCGGGQYLKTAETGLPDAAGKYTLILYGCRYSGDVENVAILAREDVQYTFNVYAPEFDFKVKKHIPAKEALKEAEGFVRCHYAFWRSRLSKIMAPEGNIIGYEVRPLYSTLEFGYPDILDINYIAQDKKVTVTISLKRELRRPLFDRDSPFPFRLGR